MHYKKLIDFEIEFTKNLMLLSEAYEEISVMQMKKIRSNVIDTRDYFGKLADIFYEVKNSYKKELQDIHTIVPRKPSVSVFMSSNNKLYGDIINKIFKLFVSDMSNDNSDIIIIGRVGRGLYEGQSHKKPYNYIEIPDSDITPEHLKPIFFQLLQYDKITVYFGRFDSMANQSAIKAVVSGDEPLSEKAAKGETVKPEETKYMFEPNLENILKFFTDLIISSLFRQTLHETQLARLSSRIMAMEGALSHINNETIKLNILKKKMIRMEENKKQVERLSGMSLWMK